MADSSETGETGEKRAAGETDDGSRSEVRGFLNFELRTQNFVSRLSRVMSIVGSSIEWRQ